MCHGSVSVVPTALRQARATCASETASLSRPREKRVGAGTSSQPLAPAIPSSASPGATTASARPDSAGEALRGYPSLNQLGRVSGCPAPFPGCRRGAPLLPWGATPAAERIPRPGPGKAAFAARCAEEGGAGGPEPPSLPRGEKWGPEAPESTSNPGSSSSPDPSSLIYTMTTLHEMKWFLFYLLLTVLQMPPISPPLPRGAVVSNRHSAVAQERSPISSGPKATAAQTPPGFRNPNRGGGQGGFPPSRARPSSGLPG